MPWASQIAAQGADMHLANGCGKFGSVFAELWLGTSSATRKIAAHYPDTHLAENCAWNTFNQLKLLLQK